MPNTRKLNHQPKYRRQKRPGDQPDSAYTSLSGQRIALGRYDSRESRRKFARVVHEWEERGRTPVIKETELTVKQLCAAYWLHVKHSPRAKPANAKPMIRATKELYGDLPARQFGPKRLRGLQGAMARRVGKNGRTWSRRYVNEMVGAVRAMFRWAVSEELVDASSLQALLSVDGLRARDGIARESKRRETVPVEHVAAVRPHVSRQVWAMIQVQRLTGARPGELVIMRPIDIDMTGEVWLYRPMTHKTAHKGKDRVIAIGERGQDVIRPFLSNRPVNAYVFDPREAEAERKARMRDARKSSVQPSQADRTLPGASRIGDHYTTLSYARAIARAVKVTFRPLDMSDSEFRRWKPEQHWSPHQLRHTRATEIREAFGEEAAQVTLGHARLDTTRLYGERNLAKAVEVARNIG